MKKFLLAIAALSFLSSIFLFKTQSTNAQPVFTTPPVPSTTRPTHNYCSSTTDTYDLTFSWGAVHNYDGTLVYELKYSTDNGATYTTLPDIPNPPVSSANVETTISLNKAIKLSEDSSNSWAVRTCDRQLQACSIEWNWGPVPAHYDYNCDRECSPDGGTCEFAADCCNSSIGAQCVSNKCTICAFTGESCGGAKGCCLQTDRCNRGVCGAPSFDSRKDLPCQAGTEDDLCERFSTALGPIDTDPGKFVAWLLGTILSLAGGIVLLIIIASGYRLMTSQGDPEKIKEARERLTAAIVGLLFIIVSLLILTTITVDILHIPGFSR